jgi:hypothetical protein
VKACLETALKEIACVKDDPKAVDVVIIKTVALGNEVERDALPELSE